MKTQHFVPDLVIRHSLWEGGWHQLLSEDRGEGSILKQSPELPLLLGLDTNDISYSRATMSYDGQRFAGIALGIGVHQGQCSSSS